MTSTLPLGFPTKPIQSKRAWTSDSDLLSEAIHPFLEETQKEVKNYVGSRTGKGPITREQIQNIPYHPGQLPNLVNEIEGLRDQVDNGIGFVVFPALENGLSVHQSRVASWLVSNAFGEPRIQDDEGSRLIEIFSTQGNPSMKTGARYHVTKEGSSPHTDGPQVLEDPDYLCLRCVSDGWKGGENTLVTADTMYNFMLEHNPDMINTLSKSFIFHRRGVPIGEGEAYFEAPILSMESGSLRLRFLDHYIRGGYEMAGIPLTDEQEGAIQYLNSLFDNPKLQFNARLEPGQQVVFANKRMLHSRTAFEDRNPPADHYDLSQLDDLETASRLMDRTWSYKRENA